MKAPSFPLLPGLPAGDEYATLIKEQLRVHFSGLHAQRSKGIQLQRGADIQVPVAAETVEERAGPGFEHKPRLRLSLRRGKTALLQRMRGTQMLRQERTVFKHTASVVKAERTAAVIKDHDQPGGRHGGLHQGLDLIQQGDGSVFIRREGRRLPEGQGGSGQMPVEEGQAVRFLGQHPAVELHGGI